MERRVVIWLLSSAIFLLLYITLQRVIGPPAPPPAAPGVAQQEPGDAEPADAPVEAAPLEPEVTQQAKRQWFTLGSMDPAAGFSMLVTGCNEGAGIERIELTARDDDGRLRYHRTDLSHGYLGYLAVTTRGGGCRVNVVGPGTPADLAVAATGAVGLKVDDIIVRAGDTPILAPQDLDAALRETQPGDDLEIEVLRPVGPGAADVDVAENAIDEGDAGGEDDRAAAKPQSLVFVAELTRHPLDLVRLASTAGPDQIPGNLSRRSCLVGISQLGDRQLTTGETELAGLPTQHGSLWRVTELAADGSSIELRLPISAAAVEGAGGSGALELVRRYRLRPREDPSQGFVIDLDLEIHNKAESPQRLAYRQEGPNGITLEGWWYSTKISPNFGGAGARDVIYNTVFEGHELIGTTDILEQAQENELDPELGIFAARGTAEERTLRYIGVDAQYFTVAYVPPEDVAAMTTLDRAAAVLVADPEVVPDQQGRAANTSFVVESSAVDIPPGGALKESIRMFAGPKDPDLLAVYGLEPAIEYGWFPFVAKPLGWILHGFNVLTDNYAIAIVLLTLLVRGALFPLGRKAAQNAQKMQELAPEFKKIAEKYKNDMEKRMTAQRELQKRHGFNPLAGCLPLLVQLPIFIGLYRTLSVDIELRQAPLTEWLTWCSNLAAPDMLAYWAHWMPEYFSGRGTGWLGPYFNILPLVVVALFMLQQKMFMPPATDEQTAMTQKVMTVMTLFMGLFFFRVASGLCIYFITSSLWGIAERKLVKKTTGATTPAAPADGPPRAERPQRPKPTPPSGDRERPSQRRPKPGAKTGGKKAGKRNRQ